MVPGIERAATRHNWPIVNRCPDIICITVDVIFMKRFDKGTVGSRVWCLATRQHTGHYKKWQSPYVHPFNVLRQLGPVTQWQEIQKNARSLPKVLHTDKLKLCIEPSAIDTPSKGDAQATSTSEPPAVDRRRPLRNRDDWGAILLTMYIFWYMYCTAMPPTITCNCCGRAFPRPPALWWHYCYCRHRPGLAADLLEPPQVTIDVPEDATHRQAGTQTELDHQLPLDAIPPSRRILRARGQLIHNLLEEAVGGQSDVGVDTSSQPAMSPFCILCTHQVPDWRAAPNREMAYIQECILARPELVGRLCRCRTCMQHSTLARRRMGAQSTATPPPFCFVTSTTTSNRDRSSVSSNLRPPPP